MKRLVVLATVIIVFLLGFFVWYSVEKIPVNPLDTSKKTFVIHKGEGIRDIAYNLKKQGFIRSPIAFFILLKQLGIESKIQAGVFTLSPSLSSPNVAEALTHGTNDVWITIPEGKRAEEINEMFMQKLPGFTSDWKSRLQQEEGYLFPDTYRFPTDADIATVIDTMRNNFEAKYIQASKNQTTKLSQSDVVILASIVEREGKSTEEMKMISSVLQNRLNLGMALQTDATVQYALGTQHGGIQTWWPTVSPQDLRLASDYNTYTHPGLPPAPIANPGYNALFAVLHPVVSNYLYYFTDPKGVTHFAKTLEEQNTNVEKYSQ